tara:strand:- start:27 stop:452 length:426 start_codon:yes stop_codon:yes gene_type:complete
MYKYILIFLLIGFSSHSAEVCKIETEPTPEFDITTEQVMKACSWDKILTIGNFSLEGLINKSLEKLKSKLDFGICKIKIKDVWDDNEDLIGQKWPGDVFDDVSKETFGELDEVLNKRYSIGEASGIILNSKQMQSLLFDGD